MNKHYGDLELFSTAITEKQRILLQELLEEEKENIEPYITQNMWVSDRIKTINSIIDLLQIINTRKY